MNEKTIVVKQIPVITHDIATVGKSVTERINALKLEAQVVTEDTVQTLKKLKAELSNEAKDWEDQRKAVKKAVNAPYDDFEAIYKAEIIEKYKSADETLKTKINEFEMKIKTEKKANLQLYFVEVCTVEKIDWLTFDRLGIDVNLSTSEKKYKEQINEFISKVVDDIKLIGTEIYAAEMLVEYKRTLNASLSITTVRNRKEEEKAEVERIKRVETMRRTSELVKMNFVYQDMTRTYHNVHHDDLMISLSDIENMPKEKFTEKVIYFEQELLSRKLPTIGSLKKEILQSPVVEVSENKKSETFEAKFKITDTYERLMALKQFLVENNYKYENI